jgi:hypothetical protein
VPTRAGFEVGDEECDVHPGWIERVFWRQTARWLVMNELIYVSDLPL